MPELQDDIIVDMPEQGDPEPKLKESDRRRLDSIVQKMMGNKESEDDISFVVNDFKKKYATKPLVTQPKEQKPVIEKGREMAGVFGNKDFAKTIATAPVVSTIEKPKEQYSLERQQRSRNAVGKSQEKLLTELQGNDDVIEKMIRQQRFDTDAQNRLAPTSEMQNTGMREFSEPQTKPQDLPVTPEDMQGVKMDIEQDQHAARRVLLEVTKQKPEKRREIENSVYWLDAVNSTKDDPNADERLKKIEQNAKGIEKGELIYNVQNGKLIKPQGVVGSFVTGWKAKSQLFDDYSFFNDKTDDEVIAELEKRRIEYDPDEPIPVPKHTLGEGSQMIGSMPVKSMIAGAAVSAVGAPEAAPFAAAGVGALDFYKMGYAGTLQNVYYQLREEGKSEAEALQMARTQAKKEAAIDAAMGGAMSFVGARFGVKPLNFSVGYKAAVGTFLKGAGKDGAMQGLIGAGGEIAKNKLAQAAGIKRDTDANVLEAIEGNFLMTVGMAAAAKLGRGLSSIKYRSILNGLIRTDEKLIDANINTELQAGRITEQQAENIRTEIKNYKELDSQIPENVTEEARLDIQNKLEKRNELEQKLEGLNKAFHPAIKEQIKAIDEEINTLAENKVKKEKLPDEVKELKKLVDDELDEGVVKGYMGDALKQAAPEDLPRIMKEISEQANDPKSADITRATFGDAIVDKAIEMFPLGEDMPEGALKVESDLKKQLKDIGTPQNVIDAISDKTILEKKLFIKGLTISGVYDAPTDSITLSQVVSAITGRKKVLLHEAVHAATVHSIHEIDGWLDKLNDLTPEKRDLYWAYSDLQDIHEAYKNTLRNPKPISESILSNDLYGLNNIEEFVAEFISNKRFRNVLQQYADKVSVNDKAAKPESVLNYIWGRILRLIGLKEQEVNEELISNIQNSIDKILEHSKSTRGSLSKISEGIESLYKGVEPKDGKSSISVMRPEEIKQHETVTIQPKEEPVAETVPTEEPIPPITPQPEPEMTGITHQQMDETAKEFGLETYQEAPETVELWDKQADERIAKDPEAIGKLLNKMRNGVQPDAIEQRMIIKYVADLKAKIRINPTDELLNEFKRVRDLSNIVGGRDVAKSLRARQGEVPVIESEADMMTAKMDANAKETLTPEEKAKVSGQFDKIDAAKKSLAEKGKEIADRIRALRPKTDSAQSQFFGLPVAIYDTALVAIAEAVEQGAKLADAIQHGIKYIKQNGGFKDKKEEKNFAAFVKGEITYDERLEAFKKRTKAATDNLKDKTKEGDFEPNVRPILELDEEARKIRSEYRKAKYEFELELQKDKLRQRPFLQKAIDVLLEPLRTVRTLMTTLDLSAVLRQGVIPTIAHPTLAAKAFPEMLRQTISKGRFDEWLADLKDSPLYDVMEKSKLYISDPNSLHLSAKEENFMSNLAEKIPVVGHIVKGSERAYVSYLNKMRADLFKQGVEVFMSDGKTIQNSPELYEGLANFINNSTGRGKLGPLEGSADFLNTVFFSPRLMASRINMLGLSDVFTAGQKGFYSQLPKEVRVMAIKDMLKFIGFGVSVLGLSKLGGAEVEQDPRSTDFGKMKFGNTRYDIWGGFQPYVRLIAQVASGQTKSTTSGQTKELNPKGRFDRVTSFLRGKLAPVPGSAVDLMAGENIIGEPSTLQSEALESITPMIISDVREAMKDQGVKALFTIGIPSAFGVSTSTYGPNDNKTGTTRKRENRPSRPKREKLRN